jgi:hypothetical protein
MAPAIAAIGTPSVAYKSANAAPLKRSQQAVVEYEFFPDLRQQNAEQKAIDNAERVGNGQ